MAPIPTVVSVLILLTGVVSSGVARGSRVIRLVSTGAISLMALLLASQPLAAHLLASVLYAEEHGARPSAEWEAGAGAVNALTRENLPILMCFIVGLSALALVGAPAVPRKPTPHVG